jgi:hypothetical protein
MKLDIGGGGGGIQICRYIQILFKMGTLHEDLHTYVSERRSERMRNLKATLVTVVT